MSETGLYLYCFAPEGGTLGPPLNSLRFDGCSAVIERVALDEFSPEHLEDLAWTAARACRHEQVIEAVMRSSAVLPARFATVFSSEERLARFVEAHGGRIREFLERVAGQEEWGVKVLANAKAAAAEPRPEEGACGSGTRYLLERKNRAAESARRRESLEEAAAAAAAELEPLASAAVERKALEPEVVRNWAFLVPRERADEFRAGVDGAARESRSLEFVVSGPWPPYSFVPELEDQPQPEGCAR